MGMRKKPVQKPMGKIPIISYADGKKRKAEAEKEAAKRRASDKIVERSVNNTSSPTGRRIENSTSSPTGRRTDPSLTDRINDPETMRMAREDMKLMGSRQPMSREELERRRQFQNLRNQLGTSDIPVDERKRLFQESMNQLQSRDTVKLPPQTGPAGTSLSDSIFSSLQRTPKPNGILQQPLEQRQAEPAESEATPTPTTENSPTGYRSRNVTPNLLSPEQQEAGRAAKLSLIEQHRLQKTPTGMPSMGKQGMDHLKRLPGGGLVPNEPLPERTISPLQLFQQTQQRMFQTQPASQQMQSEQPEPMQPASQQMQAPEAEPMQPASQQMQSEQPEQQAPAQDNSAIDAQIAQLQQQIAQLQAQKK